MFDERYSAQVSLLLRVMPVIEQMKEFALHGGTAINLFENDMPRLSVDVDLTWIPISNRKEDLRQIGKSLTYMRGQLMSRIPDIKVSSPDATKEGSKLVCNRKGITVKIEVNPINRGLLFPVRNMELCEKAQEAFDMYMEMRVVSEGQLYGGKIVATLDRQHPRDFYDVNLLLKYRGLNEEIFKGTLFFLLCSKRPLNELLTPKWKDQSKVLETQFSGMTESPFTYKELENTREALLSSIFKGFTDNDKTFILDFHHGKENSKYFDIQKYPAIQWKQKNLSELRKRNPYKFKKLTESLETLLR